MNELVINKVKEQFSHDFIESDEQYGLLSLKVKPEAAIAVLHFLYSDAELQYKFLTDLCGVHYPDNLNEELAVVYHLHNLISNHRIKVKAFLPLQKPTIKTATNLFSAANWMERETYDFYGIIFEGHPNLKRILNMDEMVEFPLRKEFPLEDPFRKDKEDRFFGRSQNNEAIINTKL